MKIDHAVILVEDLAEASADYTGLGFTVSPGGVHTDGATHNALVAFEDGSYLELIAFLRTAPEHKWWRHRHSGEGLIDYALLPDDIENDIKAAAARGLELAGPFPGGRTRPDGVVLHWQTGQPDSAGLPFLCADVTPRAWRVPSGPAVIHPNGTQGVQAVVVAVSNFELSRRRYSALLGLEPEVIEGSALFTLAGGCQIILSQNQPGKTIIDGPVQLLLKSGGHTVSFDQNLTHNVRYGFNL